MKGQPLTKREIFESFVDKGLTMVVLDARHPGVQVPLNFRSDHDLRLNFSYRFKNAPLDFDEHGITQSLTFSGQSFAVCVPWEAVYGVISPKTGGALFFPESMPVEARTLLEVPAAPPPGGNDTPAMQHIQELKRNIEAAPPGTFDSPPDVLPPPAGRPKLTLIRGGKS